MSVLFLSRAKRIIVLIQLFCLQLLFTGICQYHKPKIQNSRKWEPVAKGVCCVMKDSANKTYVVAFYELTTCKQLFEEYFYVELKFHDLIRRQFTWFAGKVKMNLII